MPQYVVFHVAGNVIPPDGQKGSADFYIGTHPDAGTATTAAAAAFGVAPGMQLWTDLASNLVRYQASIAVALG